MNKYWVEKKDNVDDVVAEDFNKAFSEIEKDMEKLSNTSGKSPYIGDNGNWYEWDSDSGEYIDTGIMAEGHTPVKGVDYWTEGDKAEIKGYVDDEIGNYETAISEIIELQKQFINEITFSLNGTNYTCPKGMTWAGLETYDGGSIWTAEGLSVSEEAPFLIMKNGYALTTIDSVAYITRDTYISDIIRDASESIIYY